MAKAKISSSNARWDGGQARFNWGAFDEIRKSPEMQALLEGIAEGIAEEARMYPEHSEPGYINSKKYGHEVKVLDSTTSAIVFPASPHAANSNAKHNTLVKIIGKGQR